MSISNLQDLFVHELRDILDAEKQLLKALPRMAKAAESEEPRSVPG
jgi:ferritin-like metal-binding protein YciE